MRAAPIYAVGLMCCVAAIVGLFYFIPDANQQEFDNAQARALSTEDPWTAYLVYKEEIRWFEHCGRTTRCPKGYREDTILQSLLLKALDSKRSDAYIELYSSRLDWNSFLKIQTEYAPKLLALVDNQTWENTNNEFAMYFVAAKLLEGGDFITADTPRAASYLIKAWQKGAIIAPLYLSRLYKRSNDFHNAYFWSLRCVGECRFNSLRETFDGYQSGLSNTEIVAIQKVVNNKTVLNVSADTLGKH